jgi:hypothetical protein
MKNRKEKKPTWADSVITLNVTPELDANVLAVQVVVLTPIRNIRALIRDPVANTTGKSDILIVNPRIVITPIPSINATRESITESITLIVTAVLLVPAVPLVQAVHLVLNLTVQVAPHVPIVTPRVDTTPPLPVTRIARVRPLLVANPNTPSVISNMCTRVEDERVITPLATTNLIVIVDPPLRVRLTVAVDAVIVIIPNLDMGITLIPRDITPIPRILALQVLPTPLVPPLPALILAVLPLLPLARALLHALVHRAVAVALLPLPPLVLPLRVHAHLPVAVALVVPPQARVQVLAPVAVLVRLVARVVLPVVLAVLAVLVQVALVLAVLAHVQVVHRVAVARPVVNNVY